MNRSFFDKAAECFPDSCFKSAPDLGIVLGSGWGDALEMDDVLVRVSYADIAGFGPSSVQGHAGEFILYRRGARRIAAWCGRHHWYEGLGWEPVVFPVEMLRRMGCGSVLLTNAAGGIDDALRPGDFVVLKDHVNTAGVNPLIGPHNSEWGPRFPDMSEVYSKRGQELLCAGAYRLGLRMLRGTYAFTAGPCYETPSEVQAFKRLGADVVGMSTVPEATFARACGFKTAALSLVSNLAAGIAQHPLGHEEVMAAGEAAKPQMRALIDDFISRL